MKLLVNKRALIVGLISDRSIAYGIAKLFHEQGAELAFTYQTEKVKTRVEDLAKHFGSSIVLPCDVGIDEEIDAVFKNLSTHWDGLDILVHSVAFAPSEQLKGDYLSAIDREGFRIAHDISSYSFSALAKAAYPLMSGRQASLLTLSYLGAERVVPNYNVMGVAKASLEANVRYLADSLGPKGIRVNAISAGPIRTLAASGIKDFRSMLAHHEKSAPLRQNVSIEQVGQAATFLCSDFASGITGEILHVDGGYHIMAMGSPEASST